MTVVPLSQPLDPDRVQRRAARPEASVWVAASAGTGKTKVLIDRVLSLLLSGTPPGRILCLTFTRSAAAQMALRLSLRLGLWASAGDEDLAQDLAKLGGAVPDAATAARARRLSAEVLEAPGGLAIMTIHAFCASLLARFPLEAGVAPHFAEMDERSAGEALVFATEEVLADAHAGGDEGLQAALLEVTRWTGDTRFHKLIGEVARHRGRFERLVDSHGGIDELIAAVCDWLSVAPDETEDRVIAAACTDGAFDAAGLRRGAAALASGSKSDTQRAPLLEQYLAAAADRRREIFDAYCGVFLTKGKVRDRLLTKDAASRHPGAHPALEAEAARLVRIVDRAHRAAMATATAALLRLAAAVVATYQHHKRAEAKLDYDDLILKSEALLGGVGAAWVLYKLDGGIDHILIDEAQDTSPDQWRIVRLLAEEFFAGEGARTGARTIFAVGDHKQSIFSFQGADPDSFEAMREHFRSRVERSQGEWDSVDLDISFRSTAAVLKVVDALFALPAAKDGLAPADQTIAHQAFRKGQAGLVELWPAVELTPPGARDPWAPPVVQLAADEPEVRLARVIAGRIRRWIAEGEILESKGRPITPADIMVLVRHRTRFVGELVRTLKSLEVTVAGVDRMVLTDQIAVRDLIALGQCLLLPDDDLTLASVLKGPLVGLDETALFDLAHGRGRRSLWRELRRRAGERADFRAAALLLAGWLGRVDFVPPYELYAEILGAGGGRELVLSRLGYDADDPIDEFLALALHYQRAHAPSLQGFLHWLESGSTEIKRDLEQAVRDEVRVMTVHGAKGLEAPIVFLPDTVQIPKQTPLLLWDALPLWRASAAYDVAASRALLAEANRRRDQEYRRLLYVAMTRAQDRLYICGWRKQNAESDGSWYALAETAMATLAEKVAFDFAADSPVGWQGTGWRLSLPQTAETEQEERGVFRAAAAEPPPDWAGRPPQPAPPALRTLNPSRPVEDEPAVISPLEGGSGDGFRRGRLIHLLLQTLPDIAPARRRASAGRYLDQPVHRLGPAERDSLIAETLAVLDHPDFAPLFQPGSRAEVPLIGEFDGALVSGQVDRLVVTDHEVLIADYKTNRPMPENSADIPKVYLRQMAAYRAVLAAIYPDRPVRCALVWTAGPRLMPVAPELLEIGLA